MSFLSNFFTPVPGGSTYNVREAVMWTPIGGGKVAVRFVSQPNAMVVFDAVQWAAAVAASDASGF